MNTLKLKQNGMVLIVSMLFLLLLSVLVATMIQSNTLQLQMAGNDESKMESMQRALAIVDVIVDKTQNVPVTGDIGYRVCQAQADPDNPVDIEDCDEYLITVSDETLLDKDESRFDGAPTVEYYVERTGPLETAIPFMDESVVSSSTAFAVARQELTVTFDRSNQGGGSSKVTQGFLRLIPAPGAISTGSEVVSGG